MWPHYKICATMGPLGTLNHLINFAAPACAVALLMPFFGRLASARRQPGPGYWYQSVVNFLVGLLVLLAGLWLGGRDARVATYAALVLVCATTQWAMQRGWKA